MRVLKALICLTLTFFTVLAATGGEVFAKADESRKTYAYVDLGREVYLCAEKDEESALFIIPDTYCVEILGKEGGWYKVKYAEDNGLYKAVYGYCPTDDLVVCDEPLENLYLHTAVKITYRTDPASPLLPALGELTVDAAYYGAYKVGKSTCSYVLCGEYFGYITGAIEDYPRNKLPSADTIAPVEEGGPNAALITALVITAVAAIAIAVLYFTGKKPKIPNE